MPAYPFNPGIFYWTPPKPYASGSFRPNGRFTKHGDIGEWVGNPSNWESDEIIVGRLIVGFSVGQVPTYSGEDLIAIVERVRTAQSGDPSASFVAQRGIYQSRKTGEVVVEDGAQVFIINTHGLALEAFIDQMVELAETVARELQQEEVILEIQRNGLSLKTIGVIP